MDGWKDGCIKVLIYADWCIDVWVEVLVNGWVDDGWMVDW